MTLAYKVGNLYTIVDEVRIIIINPSCRSSSNFNNVQRHADDKSLNIPK